MTPKTVEDLLKNWLDAAASRKLKVDERFLTDGECDLIISVLQAFGGDLAMIDK